MPESLFSKVADLGPATLLKKRLWERCFLVDFAKCLRKPIFIEHLWWLLLTIFSSNICRLKPASCFYIMCIDICIDISLKMCIGIFSGKIVLKIF